MATTSTKKSGANFFLARLANLRMKLHATSPTNNIYTRPLTYFRCDRLIVSTSMCTLSSLCIEKYCKIFRFSWVFFPPFVLLPINSKWLQFSIINNKTFLWRKKGFLIDLSVKRGRFYEVKLHLSRPMKWKWLQCQHDQFKALFMICLELTQFCASNKMKVAFSHAKCDTCERRSREREKKKTRKNNFGGIIKLQASVDSELA